MTRRRRKAKPVGDVPLVLDGEPAICVTVGNSIPFAKACLKAWRLRDGRDRRDWILRNAFWVPTSVLQRAREIVEAEASAEAEKVGP